jgi:DNA-binding LytR/AlgR family response regulator
LAPPRRGAWLRFALIHIPTTVIFSGVHVFSMWMIRIAIYAALGLKYGTLDYVYEYRKDLLGYLIVGGLVWMFSELRRRPAPAAARPGAVFDIKDGSKVIRAPVADILAVSSAGNYVEFVLADGRRPLMRSTLSAAEAALGPHRFVRIHRSWLVNAAKVREIEAAGSGDFTVRLDGGAEAPLSRRFRDALQCLRCAPEA